MIQIKQNEWKKLIGKSFSGPCVSVYAPLSGAETEYERCIETLRLDAVQQMKELGHSGELTEMILGKMRATYFNLQWSCQGQQRSLAFFASFGFSAFSLIPRSTQPLVVVSKSFHIKPLIPEISDSARELLGQEYERAISDELVVQNIPGILKANQHGRVRKLVVASDEIFLGDLESFDGNPKLQMGIPQNKAGLDDVLDDLAERIAVNSGEVLTARRSQLPNKRLALAFLHPRERDPETIPTILNPLSMAKIRTNHSGRWLAA